VKIVENMEWPPMDFLHWKMAEHSAWYSGDAELLANFYTEYLSKNLQSFPYPMQNSESFWGRQIKNQGEIFVHVPMAGDIAETSANFLFAESPIVKVAQAHEQKAAQSYKDTQTGLDEMLMDSGFFPRILEGAETCAAIGGVFVKLAWDYEVSPYPIPVIVQADRAIPEFKFGFLTAVTFWKVVDADESGSKVYRLLERYEKGLISYKLYLGTTSRLGREISLSAHDETKDLENIDTIDELLAVYVPNVLPNRLDRSSYLGRSDYSGIEGLMDSLDEVFSSWVRDVALAQARIMLPEQFLDKSSGTGRFNIDKMLYVKLDIDPTSITGNAITPQQFDIRAEAFEKTSLNLLDRIITSAGYSPQSFGLNIQGRAESGTALSMRERKSFSTKGKKENYWQFALKKLVRVMMMIYNDELNGTLDVDVDLNISFNDGITNNLGELSNSVKMISDAMAASTDTKVRLLHPDWDEEQITAEVDRIIEENNLGPAAPPDMNLDLDQLNFGKKKPATDPEPDEGGQGGGAN
jgi:hypothetical protein